MRYMKGDNILLSNFYNICKDKLNVVPDLPNIFSAGNQTLLDIAGWSRPHCLEICNSVVKCDELVFSKS